jgi:hypothetical protein
VVVLVRAASGRTLMFNAHTVAWIEALLPPMLAFTVLRFGGRWITAILRRGAT